VAPSALKAPINPATPHALTEEEILKTIADYAQCAAMCQFANYDGVEIMGSEGYLINEFLAPQTNHRDDRWGGSLENRMRFGLEVIRAVRARVGAELHHHLPPVDARPGRGRQHLGRSRGHGARQSRRPAPPSSTPASAGTRRASRPSTPPCRAAPTPG
jgi:2,4-dienoyl-CoA reductase-like NADH-dependent reductase (Old Yellow Enzyme family)